MFLELEQVVRANTLSTRENTIRLVHVFGASGLGKTSAVRCIAQRLGLSLVEYEPLLAESGGASAAQNVIEKACTLTPCLLLCDHADLYFPPDRTQPVCTHIPFC